MIDREPGAGAGHDEMAPLLPYYELGGLSAVERRAFEAHALQCDACFAELERAAPAAAALHGARARALRILRHPQRKPRAAWMPWLGGGLVGAVATAAVAAALLRPLSGGSPAGEGRGGVATTSQAPATTVPWVTPGNVRGSASSVVVSPGTRLLVLATAVPPTLDRSQPATIEVTAPGGAAVARVLVSPAELQRSSLLVLLQPPEAFRSGTYRVALWSGEPTPGQQPASEASFDIRVTGERPPP